MKTIVIGLLAAIAAAPTLADESAVAYPDGYRDWHHVKSMVIGEGHPLFGSFGGIHHLYANDAAREGYAAGRFPEGSVIVFDLLEAVYGDGAITEGPRKVLGVMEKNTAAFGDTGGWGFEGFAAGDPGDPVVGENAASACFACHAPEADHDYVYSRPRD